MSEDKQSVRLVVCPHCQEEAVIVYADGGQSNNFTTKVDGKMVLLEAVHAGHIAGEDVRKIEAEIDNSSLPFSEDSQEEPEETKRFREDRNRRRLFGGSTGGAS